MRSCFSKSARQTCRLGLALGKLCRPGDVIALVGPLGAGKTCFVQGLARGLGVNRPLDVVSPTFTLIDEHPGRFTLWHADLYRIDREEDLQQIGLRDLLPGEGVTAIEWLDRFPAYRPPDYLEVRMEMRRGTRRHLAAVPHGPRATALARAWLGRRTRGGPRTGVVV